jgi:hypothetical protein
MSYDLASELRFGRQLYLVEHSHPPTGEVTANAGVLMLRAGRWAERFLAAVWAQADLIEHRWWDNAAVMRLLGYRIDPQPACRERRTRWRVGVRFLDVAWNSVPHWHPSPVPRIVHFAGLPLEERREQMLATVKTRSHAHEIGRSVAASTQAPISITRAPCVERAVAVGANPRDVATRIASPQSRAVHPRQRR